MPGVRRSIYYGFDVFAGWKFKGRALEAAEFFHSCFKAEFPKLAAINISGSM